MDDRIISISCIGTGRWTKPEYEVVELGMEVGAYAGNA